MRILLALCFAFAVFPQTAEAKAHLWRFTEVFSNADGSVQFIEMFVFDPAGTDEIHLGGFQLTSNRDVFVFPNNLPSQNTFHTWVLIATPAFAALPGAPTPDYVIPPGFFDPAGDELRYGLLFDILPFPAVPTDGIHSYLRDGSTAVNSPTNFAGVEGSIDVSRPCDDTLDNDADGRTDYPDDPACRDANWPRENAQCQDGIDNDGALGTDFDGGVSVLGAGNGDPNGADPQCTAAYLDTEAAPPTGCGLGPELVPALASLAWLARRRRGFAQTPQS
jgi:hypothetical protein